MKITVVGDTLLDEDVDGTSTRDCPDAPVPVIEELTPSRRAGGAGLAATMLALDGHDVTLVTALSDDEDSAHLRHSLGSIRLVAGASEAPTPVKTRIRSNSNPVCRLDRGCEEPPVPTPTEQMLEAIATAETILVADYGRNLLQHPSLRDALERRAAEVPLVWDPHPRGATPLANASLATPNLAEASATVNIAPSLAHAAQAAAELRSRWGCRAVVVTLGDAGALVHDRNDASQDISTRKVTTSDPCGAGDRFAASAAIALAAGADCFDAVRQGVEAASTYLASGGVTSLQRARDVDASRPAREHVTHSRRPRAISRISEPSRSTAKSLINAIHSRGGTVVATGGCFDLLHAGHVRTLEAARALGDALVVCLNSDASVRRLKGAQRPIVQEDERAELLSALACIDGVVLFDEDSPEKVLAELRPDIWVKGGDYTVQSLPEAQLFQQWGGRVVTVPYHLGRSTTLLAEKLAKVS